MPDLRQLAEAATPGPWRFEGVAVCSDGYEVLAYTRHTTFSDMELAALAPSLAVLCADMADALAGIKAEIPDVRERNRTLFGGMNVYLGDDEAAAVEALLARFRALTQEPT